MNINNDHPLRFLLDNILPGDCAEEMQRIPNGTIDLVVTDPPYIAKYKDRSDRRVLNDDNWRWVAPTFSQVYRVLRSIACSSPIATASRSMGGSTSKSS
jgi:DNA modification methylase